MPVEPFQRIEIGRTGLTTTRLGLGGASIGGLFRPVADADAIALVDHAWVDRRPLLRCRAAVRLRQRRAPDGRRARGAAARRVRPLDEGRPAGPSARRRSRPDADVDRQSDGVRDDAYYTDLGDRGVVFDYSGDGVRRSLEESLERLGLSRVDIVYIHDPDDHWDAVMRGAYPALERLRAEGTVRAIGAGMNQSAMLARFVAETDIDIVMLAGRYTLLDQEALPDLLPRCAERGVAVMVVGVMNSGVLADPAAGAHFDYRPAPDPVVDRVRRIAAVCERHGVPLRAAAIQFPLAHPSVTGLIAGRPDGRPPRRLPGGHAAADPGGALGRAAARRAHPGRGAGRRR